MLHTPGRWPRPRKRPRQAKQTLADAKKKVDKLAHLQQAITETAKDLKKATDMSGGNSTDAAKLKDLKEARRNVGAAIEQLAKDLHIMPETAASNDLLKEMSEIYERVKQAPGK